jgi:glycosyltransferase involved in cell wall biosynthesis
MPATLTPSDVKDRPVPLETAQTVLHTRVVTSTGGGPEKTILNSPRFLIDSGYEAHCAYLHPPNDAGFESIRDRARKASAQLHSIEDRRAFDFKAVRSLLQLCRRLNVRIWHAHDYKTNLLGLLLRPFHPMKLVTTLHGWDLFTRKTSLYYAIDRRCLPRYDRVICVSDTIQERALQIGVPANRCILIPNAIDTVETRRAISSATAKKALGFDRDRLLIGACGRLSDEKAFDLLIDAVTQLHRNGIPAELAIAGDGELRLTLKQQIQRQPHPERFHLLGFQADLKSFYQALDVFVLSSRREGLPNVLLEAMCYETPVVATTVGGVPGVVQDGINGLLIPSENAEALTTALQSVLTNSQLRTTLGVAGRETIVSKFDFAVRMRKVRAVYDSLS